MRRGLIGFGEGAGAWVVGVALCVSLDSAGVFLGG